VIDNVNELYQEIILDHNRSPRHFNKIPDNANRESRGDNPLCGDRFKVNLRVNDHVIEDVGFSGEGCAISKASASLMMESIIGKTLDEAKTLFHDIHDLLTGKIATQGRQRNLGKLGVLSGVREYPMRVKCATLAWHILQAAITDQKQPVSTE